jgi:8-oxo-dGTP pyrophosphatase MutT (NUDIX family)
MSIAPDPPSASAEHAGIAISPVADGSAVQVHIAPRQEPAGDHADRIARVWAELRAANDRYYDGPILRVMSVDPDRAQVLCRRDSFRSLAVSSRLGLGIRQLGVTGIITARDRRGVEHIILGRRAADTRIYPGLWELAPSGGVKPPPPNVDRLSIHSLGLALAEEAEEELGMTLAPTDARLIAFLRDELASSVDAVLCFDLPEPLDPRTLQGTCPLASEAAGRWEYLDSAWIARGDLPAFARDHAAAIAPPTAALLRWLNWA